MVKLEDFKEVSVGDMITLSDIQTQKEYNSLSADFKVREVRTYDEPNGIFSHKAIICDYENKDGGEGEEQSIMVLLRNFTTIGEWDLMCYYLDQDGDISEFVEHLLVEVEDEEDYEDEDDSEEECECGECEHCPVCDPYSFEEEYDEDEEEAEENEADNFDLVESFEVEMHFDDDVTSEVKWDKKQIGSIFGVKTTMTDKPKQKLIGSDEKTLAEYFTEDDTQGNPHCFIEWTGDAEDGYIEVWYGTELATTDLEIFDIK